MKRAFLGEFEEIVLLAVVVSGQAAYGVQIREEILRQTGRDLTLSAIHATLHRLEDKGYLTSCMGEPTAERGGRRKRFFALTQLAVKALTEIQQVRNQFWNAFPAGSLQLKGI